MKRKTATKLAIFKGKKVSTRKNYLKLPQKLKQLER